MKKLLALLLALLLPTAAFAETYELTLRLGVNETVMKDIILDTLGDSTVDENAANEDIVDTLVGMLSNTGVALKLQEDAAALELILSGETLLDLMLHMQEDRVVLTSSLLRDYAIVSDVAAGDAANAVAVLETADWPDITGTLAATILNWIDALEPTVETGSFIGDAYEGGTVCTTVVLTDSDIAGLVRLLLTDDLRSMITSCGADGAAALSAFDELNDRVADEDRYAYLLRIVEDDQEAFVGASLTIFDELAQVATLSLGQDGKEWKLIFGMGLNGRSADQNYWLDATYANAQLGSRVYHGGSITDWTGDKESSYAYVVETTEPLSTATWYFNTLKSGKRITFDAAVTEETYLGSIRLSGSVVTSPLALDCTLSVYDMGVSIMDLDVDLDRCDPLPPLDDAYTLLSATAPEDAEAYADATDTLTTMLTVRLLKVLPLDKLLPLLNPLTIE